MTSHPVTPPRDFVRVLADMLRQERHCLPEQRAPLAMLRSVWTERTIPHYQQPQLWADARLLVDGGAAHV